MEEDMSADKNSLEEKEEVIVSEALAEFAEALQRHIDEMGIIEWLEELEPENWGRAYTELGEFIALPGVAIIPETDHSPRGEELITILESVETEKKPTHIILADTDKDLIKDALLILAAITMRPVAILFDMPEIMLLKLFPAIYL